MSILNRVKRRLLGGAAGAPSTLLQSEIAYNEADDTLYIGVGSGSGGNAANVKVLAGQGAFDTLSSDQTVTGNKTYTKSPQVPTATAGDSSQSAASTAFVQNAVTPTAKPANQVLAGPASGANAVPAYRALVVADIPPLPSTSISDFTAAADARITAQKGNANGLAPLGSDSKIPSVYLPSYVDDVVEVTSFSALPSTGSNIVIYVTQDTNKIYRWSGASYIEISASPGSTDAVAEGSTNLYFTQARVLATVLSGLTTASAVVIASSDTILSAIGKLQAQINGRLVAANNLSDLSSPGTARTNLGLGTMATQNASAVAITGGTIDNIILDGGTF